ncbi:MAG: flagellar filament capping protein FliD, partial [Synergistaceae bacterium]|nr:flagellar filament capping protein FliD [Synergistaceae bacterium]
MAMSITGVVSGIDWDSMVSEMIESASQPAYIALEKRDTLELKKTLWEELQVALQNLQSTLSPLKLASTFRAKEIEIERIDSNTSYKGVLSATVNADAEINLYDLQVLQLAKTQVNRSNQLSGTLGNIFGSGGSSSFYVNAGGQKVRIEVSSTDTLESLAERINTQLKTQASPVAVTASVVDNRLILKSDYTGLDKTTQTATVTRSVNAADTLDFTVDMGNGGVLTIKGSDGTTYKMGEDFDIVNGNQIRWRRYDTLTPSPGTVYQDTYTAYAGDAWAMTAQRSTDGDVDEGVLPFTPLSTDITITSNGGAVSYTYGDDFEVGVDGSIHWLGIRRPAAGADYEVVYGAAGGETFTFDITRSNQDLLTGTDYADFSGGTTVIRQSGRTWREGTDFNIVQGSNGEAVVQWNTGGGGDAPEPGTAYDLTLQKSDGTTVAISGVSRTTQDAVSLPGGSRFISEPHGTHSVTYNGQPVGTAFVDFTPSLDVASPDASTPGTALLINWATPTAELSTHTKVPTYDTEYTVEYTCNTATFYLSDDGSGALAALGLDLMDEDHYTAAQDAILLLDGETVTRSSNTIGESYGNELITGMTLQLKGVGQVSLDVSQNAESAVTALQDFLTAYNDILDWINVRMTEEELDETTAATVDSDDFRMKWGLLRGNSLLRTTKDSMRRLTSQMFASSFTERISRNAIYGTMSQNGISSEGIFTVTAGGRTASVAVTPEDTLATIAAKINSPTINGLNNPLFYDADGAAYDIPYAKAAVEGNKLVISAGTDNAVSLGGSTAVLSSLGLNYEYASLSQIGIKLASTGEMSTEGQSGELTFDTSVFMAALEANADDVAMLVTNFATQMQTFVDNMIKSSQKEVAAGVTTAQGA